MRLLQKSEQVYHFIVCELAFMGQHFEAKFVSAAVYKYSVNMTVKRKLNNFVTGSRVALSKESLKSQAPSP